MSCGSGEVCSGGTCGLSCGGSTPTLCGTSCVNTSTDRTHCGGCAGAGGTTCSAGELCVGGTCTLSCGGSTPTSCAGGCVDTTSNRNHCGMCGHVCASGEVCTSSVCTLSCPTGLTNCSGLCTSTAYDPANCGMCGTVCPPRNTCVAGVCRRLAGFTGATGPSWSTVPSASGRGLQAWVPTGSPTLHAGNGGSFLGYNLSAMTWTTLPGSPVSLAAWGSPAQSSGSIWEIRPPSITRYTISTGTWTTVRSDVTGTNDESMTVSDDAGNIWAHVASPSTLVRYNIAANTLSYFPTPATGSTYETRVGYDADSNSIYFGGFAAAIVNRFNIGTSVFTRMADHPEGALNDIFCSDHSGHLYAAGGFSGTTLWQLNIATNTWSRIVDFPIDHGNNGSCGVVEDGYLYMETGTLTQLYRIALL